MIHPDRKDGIRLVTDTIPPHRQTDRRAAYESVSRAPESLAFSVGLNIARWRAMDIQLTNLVSQRLGREMRGQ